MDTGSLAEQLTSALAPFLPYLSAAGHKAAQETGARFGDEAWAWAKQLWARLHPRVQAQPAAQEAAVALAAAPENNDARAALRLQLGRLLAADEAWAADLERLLPAPAHKPVNQQAVMSIGERSVAVGHDVRGGTISTGDQQTARPQ